MGSIATGDCAADLCPVPTGFLWAQPSIVGNTVLLVAFGLLILANIFIAVRYRTTVYSTAIILGLGFEIMGYVGRVLLRDDLNSRSWFVLFVIGTVMGPTFISAGIFTVLPHVFVMYGKDVSLVSNPLYVGFFFLALDVFTIAFQAVGAAFTVSATTVQGMHNGANVLAAGLALQILSLAAFFGLLYCFLYKLNRSRHSVDTRNSDIYLSARFKIFLLVLQIAAAFIFIRTICRLVQFTSGLDSAISQSETFTLVLDGALVLFAVIVLTITPPGAAFASAWSGTSPHASKRYSHQSDNQTLTAGAHQLQHQRSPYAQPPTGQGRSPHYPPSYHTQPPSRRQYQQQPFVQPPQPMHPPQEAAHWRHPGYARPAFGKHAPPGKQRAGSAAPPYEIAHQQVPFVHAGALDERSDVNPTTSGGKEGRRPRPLSQGEEVQSDAIWD